VDLIEAGGNGVISVAANLVPALMEEMVHSALDGDLKKAREIEQKLMPLFKATFIETNPIPIKTAMAMKGWCREEFRLPMCRVSSEENYAVIRQAVESLDLRSQNNKHKKD